MKFIIDRQTWRCGGDKGPNQRGLDVTALKNDKGFMCCLGQVAVQMGCSHDAIRGCGEPGEIGYEERPKLVGVLARENDYGGLTDTDLVIDAIGINDDEHIGDAEREARLTEEFALYGHDIEFSGEYVIPEPVAPSVT